jgi:hypothetical protein
LKPGLVSTSSNFGNPVGNVFLLISKKAPLPNTAPTFYNDPFQPLFFPSAPINKDKYIGTIWRAFSAANL